MAKLRKFAAYRRIERPYTRVSKYRKKSFIKSRPNSKIIRYDMGDSKKDYDFLLELKSKDDLQIRHNAIESARQSANRELEKFVGKNMYHLKIAVYPHHVLRENPLASGAGADRMSTGMKQSFGKAIGIAAQVKRGQTLMALRVRKANLKTAQNALKKAYKKLPCSCMIVQQALRKELKPAADENDAAETAA